jgi:hypothetical protein
LSSDRSLICRDCGTSFVFSVGEQDFYDRKGFTSEPSRCRNCRAPSVHGRSTTDSRTESSSHPDRRVEQLFAAVCSQCGQDTLAPAILVLGDGPIYCAPCSAIRQDARDASTGGWRDSW